MSAAAKMRHTEVTIKQGKETVTLRISPEAGQGLISLLMNLQEPKHVPDNESILAADAFPNIKNDEKRIGIVFRGIRFKHNMTQIEVAKRLGIDQADVSKIEKGKRPIGKALAKKIEKEFGVDYRRFL